MGIIRILGGAQPWADISDFVEVGGHHPIGIAEDAVGALRHHSRNGRPAVSRTARRESTQNNNGGDSYRTPREYPCSAHRSSFWEGCCIMERSARVRCLSAQLRCRSALTSAPVTRGQTAAVAP